ncbi:hypothetical protein C8C83_1580 [Flavobacterium sp. 90]|uniref:hypothetical protein n=1 Tax=unclassified Flavobacterium TaxID=196869 RepID=UPI000EB4067F|nr:MULTISPECIES: hypothetical protein [unclassified Flavobacterium]RKR09919.1 hypothetical protein C8C82_1882 [Flavobacterium sp. 81]TCK53704.1 hypothetical protein C8C83_1580 [Flavobacterium sp. 90]
MLKNILNLEGAQELSIFEKKSINGGAYPVEPICGYVTWNASETVCLNYDPYYRPVYLGNNKCSIVGDAC